MYLCGCSCWTTIVEQKFVSNNAVGVINDADCISLGSALWHGPAPFGGRGHDRSASCAFATRSWLPDETARGLRSGRLLNLFTRLHLRIGIPLNLSVRLPRLPDDPVVLVAAQPAIPNGIKSRGSPGAGPRAPSLAPRLKLPEHQNGGI